MHMFSACSIFIINASLWKTLQATLLFLLMRVSVFISKEYRLLILLQVLIYRNDSLFMKMYKYKIINKTRFPRCNALRERARAIPPPRD